MSIYVDPKKEGVGEKEKNPEPERKRWRDEQNYATNATNLRWMKKENLTCLHFSRMKVTMTGCMKRQVKAS